MISGDLGASPAPAADVPGAELRAAAKEFQAELCEGQGLPSRRFWKGCICAIDDMSYSQYYG